MRRLPSTGRSIYERKHPAPELTNSTAAKATFHPEKTFSYESTPTTPHTGPGHDLQHTNRDTPCSSKHIEAPCSLQHINYSTICFGHVPHRTDDSYHLQGHVPIQATCPHQS
ncbi:hypothetical protein DY000_02030682 [Brassica cretica]|uniref:Uncharacterized protein n=1 Tax=Brassica cretica TaxID=69181 RepID=A0ABQ7DN14_BRACR|nr:hypothetical protein DY000_02030682 [Brassica cretica]